MHTLKIPIILEAVISQPNVYKKTHVRKKANRKRPFTSSNFTNICEIVAEKIKLHKYHQQQHNR